MDQIVYCVVTNGGGVDGDEPRLKAASFNKASAEAALDARSHLETKVVDTAAVIRMMASKLDPVERLCLATMVGQKSLMGGAGSFDGGR